jgi:hypothetical protein
MTPLLHRHDSWSTRQVVQTAAAVLGWVLFWIGAGAGVYLVYRNFWLVLLGALVCGVLINRWWAIALSLVPVVLSFGTSDPDGPAFLIMLFLIAPFLAVALAVGVALARGVARARRSNAH